jgi:hypothetical protein
MAFLYISEFANAAIVNTGTLGSVPFPAPEAPPVAEQKIAIASSSTPSNAFNSATTLVQLSADAICSVEFGSAPVATTSNSRMAANETRVYGVPAGGTLKVATITNT